ncbi:MAG: efflux RND transporter permease subunit [Elusimicrobia bacterium]|nr:efflux RND transporter permease subunit [Elusimicrobiota bacterium]
MKLIRLAVERPVTTAMLYAAILLLGIIALLSLPRELFPTISFPELLIVTRYGAAAPEEIENIVTKLIEEQAGTVPNLRKIRSISKEGLSVVILEFNWGTDMSFAHLAVREKIDLIKDRLPQEAEEPIVQPYNPFAQPMMVLSASGELSLADLTRLANDVVKKRLQKVDGVASATVSGGQEREILVEVDVGKMQASNISLSGIVDSLKTSNVNYPAGTTQGRFYEYLVRTIGEFKTVADIGKTVIAVDTARDSPEFMFKSQSQRKGSETFQPRHQRMLSLQTIAEIKDTFKEIESYSRYKGKSNVSVAIQKQFDANTIKAASRVRRALKEVSLSLPKEMNLEVVYDESEFIKDSLRDVMIDGILGGIFAFLVLLFFLRNFQDALIVTLSLPVSIIVYFVFVFFMGRSINVIGLMGLSLSIGSITDNAICVLDNIDKYRRKLGNLIEASVLAPSEIFVAQFSSMLTNVVVFLPLLFAQGLSQQLFKDLSYAAIVTNIAALVVAVTLIPRITAYPLKWGKKKEELKTQSDQPKSDETEDQVIGIGGKVISKTMVSENKKESPLNLNAPPPVLNVEQTSSLKETNGSVPNQKINKCFLILKKIWNWLSQGLTEERSLKLHAFYEKYLVLSIAHKKLVLRGASFLFLFSFVIFYFKSKIFMPSVDQGQFLIKVNMPIGTRLDVTDRVVFKIESLLSKMDGVKDTLIRVGATAEESIDALGSHQGECVVGLDLDKLKSTEKFILVFKEKLKQVKLEGAEIEYILQDSTMKSMTVSAPIAITIKGPDLAALRKLSDDIQNSLKKIKGIEGVKTSLALPSFETRVSIDKDRASAFGLSVSEIARGALIGVRGFIATFFKEQGKEFGIRVRLREEDRNNPATITRVALRSPQGVMVPLGDVAQISSGYGPSEIQRSDQQRSVVISAQVIGRSLGEVIEEVENRLTGFRSKRDYSVELGGAKKEMQESFAGLFIAFMLAIVLIYMIMAAGFESLLHPFLIMITVPLGVIGVALTLLLTFTPLSVPVIIGIVLLGGIVVNNGIVLIDHINELRKEGMELIQAVILGCKNRLRPVLMTALVTVLALVPSALGTGIFAPMALATFGGLFISTALTLIILPLIYLHVEEKKLHRPH